MSDKEKTMCKDDCKAPELSMSEEICGMLKENSPLTIRFQELINNGIHDIRISLERLAAFTKQCEYEEIQQPMQSDDLSIEAFLNDVPDIIINQCTNIKSQIGLMSTTLFGCNDRLIHCEMGKSGDPSPPNSVGIHANFLAATTEFKDVLRSLSSLLTKFEYCEGIEEPSGEQDACPIQNIDEGRSFTWTFGDEHFDIIIAEMNYGMKMCMGLAKYVSQ